MRRHSQTSSSWAQEAVAEVHALGFIKGWANG
ncbi:S-layer homology domain-containing protein [Paenibacillus lutimineralis]